MISMGVDLLHNQTSDRQLHQQSMGFQKDRTSGIHHTNKEQ